MRAVFPDIWIESDNKLKGHSYGVELALDWAVRDFWRFKGAYTYLKMQLNPDAGSTDVVAEIPEGESPRHQFSIRSSMDLTQAVELDIWARYVDDLPSQKVAGHIALDVGLGWNFSKNLRLSVTGQNLLENRHPEFGSDFTPWLQKKTLRRCWKHYKYSIEADF